MNFSKQRMRLSILAVAAALLIVFAVRDTRMASDSVTLDDLLFLFAIYAIPFVIFSFMVWTARWSDLKLRPGTLSRREMIAAAGKISGTVASGMFLLNLPLWVLLAAHESFASGWLIAGTTISMLAILCALAGSPRLWRHAIASALLIPFWVTLAGLLAKALMD